ncbi:MAG TPA: endolytic transglycosylase MltG [Acidobacteriota bacterium]|nr:endolytic transglycosylase MltG [Acidobacteriota bacterium]
MRNQIILLLTLLLSSGAIATGWVVWQIRTPYYAATGETFVDIPRGAGPGTIAGLLTQAGVLRTRLPFLIIVRWNDGTRRLKAGEYRFTAAATPEQVMQRLMRGDVFYVSVTVPEGLTARETVQHIAGAGLGNPKELENALLHTDWIRDLAPEAASLEGYLFPETYHFPRKVSSEQIVKSMVDQFKLRFARLTDSHPIPKNWTASQIVTLASMIEKEVQCPDERPIVASVLVNRLVRGIPLACDPTIIYALKLQDRYDGTIHKSDLGMDSLYNSYTHVGLPPGPIANPGEESLKAALIPQTTDYLFYVSRNDGTHQFSKDLRSHLSAVARFQKRLNRRPR